MHHRKGCDEPGPEIESQGLQEERHSTMVASGGIALYTSNSLHSLPVRSSTRCAFFDLDGRLGGYSTYATSILLGTSRISTRPPKICMFNN